MADKIKNTPDRVRSEVGELSNEDLLRISQRILGVLEEEHCTVAQAGQILVFTKDAAATLTPVSCSSLWKEDQ